MALNTYEQIIRHTRESRRVVVALAKKISADNLGAAFALSSFLNHLNKPYQAVIERNSDNFEFIKQNLNISSGFKQTRRLVMSLDITQQGLDKFYYTMDPHKTKLEVFIVPANGFFNPDDVRVGQGGFEYDLIITLGASDLFSLGSVYQDNTAFFHETPIINIDYKASNEKFGEINLVEPVKSSISEILFDFFEANFKNLIDKQTATALLAGILERTQSFRAPTLAPQTLEKASRLMAYDADRELAVRELFYNKSLSLVKLWGRVLARLKEDKSKNLYWSLINTDDYQRAKADPEIIDKVFEEVLNYLPKQAAILLFSEFNKAILVLAYCGDRQINLQEKLAQYKITESDNAAKFKMHNTDLLNAEKEILGLF